MSETIGYLTRIALRNSRHQSPNSLRKKTFSPIKCNFSAAFVNHQSSSLDKHVCGGLSRNHSSGNLFTSISLLQFYSKDTTKCKNPLIFIDEKINSLRREYLKNLTGSTQKSLVSKTDQICSLNNNKSLIVLGKGSFGVVVLGEYKKRKVAIKIIRKNERHKNILNHVIKGERNAIKLNHPHIISTLKIDEQIRDVLIIMELVRGKTLQTLIEDTTSDLSHKKLLRYALQISKAIYYLHNSDIIHLDIKPANVLVNDIDICKVGDFGCSEKLSFISSPSWTYLNGTLPYRAPELWRGITPTEKVDIYSFGITLWQMLTRQKPYEDYPSHTVIYLVVSQNLRPYTQEIFKNNETSVLINLFEDCWATSPFDRPSSDVLVITLTKMFKNCQEKEEKIITLK